MFEYIRGNFGFGGNCDNEAHDIVSSFPLFLMEKMRDIGDNSFTGKTLNPQSLKRSGAPMCILKVN